jgi:ABC-type glycerol-3-phosphate transport system substrate-binding protein
MKHPNLKTLSTLIATLFIFLTFVLPNAQNQKLVIWSRYDLNDTEDANAVTLKTKIEAFEADTGVDVVYEQVAWDQLSPKLAIAVQSGGDVPDIVESGSQHIPSLLDAGALMPLDDLLAGSAWVSELNDGDKLACVVEGVRYCVAHNVRGGMTYYRTASFPDGFPATTEAWLETAPTVAGDGKYFGTQFAGRSYGAIEVMWWPMIASNGGAIFDEEGKPAWVSEEVAEVVEFGRTLFNEGYFPELNITGDFADAEAPWIDGSAASFGGGSWSAIFVPGLQDAVDAGEVMMTGGVDFGGGPHVFMVSEGWVVPTGAVNTEAAARWLDAFFEPQFLADWAAAQYGIPTLATAYEAAEFDSAFYQSVDDILGTQGLYMQQSPYYVESLDTLAVAFQELLLDPSLDVMTRLEEARDEVLNRYW